MKPTKLYNDENSNFTVTPKPYGYLIYFNCDRRGGSACWDTERSQWKPIKHEVGESVKRWLERHYNLSA